MQDQAMLTIILPTFNKKDYIAQTLDSIFMQKTIYSYQVIIADDASSDGTLDIVREYSLKYPNAIQILDSLGLESTRYKCEVSNANKESYTGKN